MAEEVSPSLQQQQQQQQHSGSNVATTAIATTTAAGQNEYEHEEHEHEHQEEEEEPVSVATAVLFKYHRAAVFVTGDPTAAPEDIAPWIDERLLDKNIPPLFSAGLRLELVSGAMAELGGMGGGVKVAGTSEDGGAFGRGLDEERLRAIVEGEATRRPEGRQWRGGGQGDTAGGGRGEGEEGGQDTRVREEAQTGPYQNR